MGVVVGVIRKEEFERTRRGTIGARDYKDCRGQEGAACGSRTRVVEWGHLPRDYFQGEVYWGVENLSKGKRRQRKLQDGVAKARGMKLTSQGLHHSSSKLLKGKFK